MTTVDQVSTGDLIKAMSVMTVFMSAVLGLIVKAVLNGTARRSRSTESTLNKHVESVTEEFHDLRNRFDERVAEVHSRIDDGVRHMNSIDVRLGRIEGARDRWIRRGDDQGDT